ncbi:MAG: hypothetical protein L0241_25685 [Planctomycetia bacterium]|nr:hypothetical protein [Planctomycetia bacterium]
MPTDDDRPKKPVFLPMRNPLTVIGSFLTLVYGLGVVAAGILVRGPDPQYVSLLWVVVIFLVIFPFFILGILTWLIVRHTDKLYSPSEFGEHKPSWMKSDAPAELHRVPKKKRAPRPRKPKTDTSPHPGEEHKP